MGCNCGKSKDNFKKLVAEKNKSNNIPNSTPNPTPNNTPTSPNPPNPPMSRAERIRLRGLRIEARNKRMAERNAAILNRKK